MITTSEFNIDISARRFSKLLINWPEHIHAFDSVHEIQVLSSEEGFPVIHQRISCGVPLVSNRSMYTTLYHMKDDEELIPLGGEIPEDEDARLDRGFTYLVSDEGNEMW